MPGPAIAAFTTFVDVRGRSDASGTIGVALSHSLSPASRVLIVDVAEPAKRVALIPVPDPDPVRHAADDGILHYTSVALPKGERGRVVDVFFLELGVAKEFCMTQPAAFIGRFTL